MAYRLDWSLAFIHQQHSIKSICCSPSVLLESLFSSVCSSSLLVISVFAYSSIPSVCGRFEQCSEPRFDCFCCAAPLWDEHEIVVLDESSFESYETSRVRVVALSPSESSELLHIGRLAPFWFTQFGVLRAPFESRLPRPSAKWLLSVCPPRSVVCRAFSVGQAIRLLGAPIRDHTNNLLNDDTHIWDIYIYMIWGSVGVVAGRIQRRERENNIPYTEEWLFCVYEWCSYCCCCCCRGCPKKPLLQQFSALWLCVFQFKLAFPSERHLPWSSTSRKFGYLLLLNATYNTKT